MTSNPTYEEYLTTKKQGFVFESLPEEYIATANSNLFNYQLDIVKWALRKGRAAIFAECGMGKTIMQLSWAQIVADYTNKPILILAPPAVAIQTAEENRAFGFDVNICREGSDIKAGLNITNYEKLHLFDDVEFGGVVLDESSILKSYTGHYCNALIERFASTPYKLACTATPAPNDFMELGNHCEFLGIMTREEMLAKYFIHDGGDTAKWRLKGHGRKKFWEFVCEWAVLITHPRDLGYEIEGFDLPEISYIEHIIPSGATNGMLIPMAAQTLQERIQARRDTVDDRVGKCADIINLDDDCWLVWGNLNAETDLMAKSINGAIEVSGSDKDTHKEKKMMDFTHGNIKRLVTKPKIAGFGMNWQHCNKMAFVGLSDSYEQFYQAVRRCWRFGQKKPVEVHIFVAETEGNVLANIKRKDKEAKEMQKQMLDNMKDITMANIKKTEFTKDEYQYDVMSGNGWTIHNGDCVEGVAALDDESIGYSIFSPPFASLYTYSNSDRDMGNCKSSDDFATHFGFLIKELFRVLKSGRLVSFHCMNLPSSKQNDGFIGIKDFRGELIRAFQDAGFIYHSEVVIWKDPVIAMQRTKALGLLHKQIKKDSAMSRQGIPDYLVTMRKPGINPEPITHTNDSFPVHLWQKYASPVWMDINPSDTLQFREARESDDERHICPLQLQVIERAIDLWSNPDDLVLSPFAGIGSEGYVAITKGRQFVGYELKKSYFDLACRNLQTAKKKSIGLFDIIEEKLK